MNLLKVKLKHFNLHALVLILSLIAPVASHAHDGHDDAEHTQELFSEFVNKEFMLKGDGHYDPSFKPYVVLKDGKRFDLDPDLLKSSVELAQVLAAADRDHTPEKRRWWRSAINNTLFFAQRHFWIELGATASMFYYRFGVIPALIVGGFEVVEHSTEAYVQPFVPFPLPPLCPLVFAVCTFGAQQVQDLSGSLLYRYPSNDNIFMRTTKVFDTSLLRYRFWRQMRKMSANVNGVAYSLTPSSVRARLENVDSINMVLKSAHWASVAAIDSNVSASCDHNHLPGQPCPAIRLFKSEGGIPSSKFVNEALAGMGTIDPEIFERPLNPLLGVEQRGFAALEQLSVLNRELKFAKRAIDTISDTRTGTYFKLIKALSFQMNAFDSYSFALKKLALSADPLAAERGGLDLVRMYPEQQHQFLRDLEGFMNSLREGMLEFNTERSRRLFDIPRLVSKELKRFKKGGCDRLLHLKRPDEKSIDEDTDELLPLAQ